MVPEPALALRLLRRGAGIWFVLRAMLLFAGMLTRTDAASAGTLFVLDPRTLVALLAVVGGTGVVVTRRAHETVFLANLGVAPAVMVALLVIPTVVAELALGMLVR